MNKKEREKWGREMAKHGHKIRRKKDPIAYSEEQARRSNIRWAKVRELKQKHDRK